MKIVFLHTDFRVYWIPRFHYLNTFFSSHNIELHIVEIAGNGSPYAFSEVREKMQNWHCLFPEGKNEELPVSEVRKKVLSTLDSLQPDIVFAGAIAYSSGMAGIKWARSHKIPVVIFDNARASDVQRSFITNFIKSVIYKNVDALLIPAPSHNSDYRRWGFPDASIYHGLNVVDNDYWKRLSLNHRTEQIVQEKFSIPEHFVLGVGRQVPKKNWLSVLKAYSFADTDFSLVLVGNGPERAKLEEYIQQNKLHGKVQILDFQPPEILAILYKKAMATILPSQAGETWGLTVNEAMACGSLVIVSSQCGCCETLCQDGITGFRVTTAPDSIAKAFQRLSALSAGQFQAMRRNAEATVADWGMEKFSQSVLQVAETLTSRKAPGYYSLLSRIIISLWKGRYRPV